MKQWIKGKNARLRSPAPDGSNEIIGITPDFSLVFDQPAGNQLGKPSTVELNVHAGWETAGTVIFGALVVLIFVIGIVRTVRKRRRAARTAE